jgi:hypothetical protein
MMACCVCDGQYEDVSSSFYGNWSSLATSVVTVDTYGVHTPQSLGSTTTKTSGYLESTAHYPICPDQNRTPSGGANVLQVSQTPTQLNLSTGDTTKQITVNISPNNVSVNTPFTSPLSSNPNSSYTTSLTIPGNNNVQGSSASTVTASNCTSPCSSPSGSFTATASANGAASTNNTTVNVPPQVLIQMMYGEADGTGTNGQLGVGLAARNRIGDTTYFSGDTNYQNTIVSSQFNGINTSITTGVEPELDNAVNVWLNITTNFISPSGGKNSACFWTPTSAQWSQISAAVQSGTTDETQVPNATGCYSGAPYDQQIRVVTSVGTNSSGVPWFVFQGPRSSSSSPVAIQF